MPESINDLERQLKKYYLSLLEKTHPDKGHISGKDQSDYIRGFKDALDMVTAFKKRRAPVFSSAMENNLKDLQTVRPQLWELSAEKIAKLDLNGIGHKKYGIGLSDLIETAFRLENQLLELLEDPGTIPIEAYESVDSKGLIQIISVSSEKNLQVENRR